MNPENWNVRSSPLCLYDTPYPGAGRATRLRYAICLHREGTRPPVEIMASEETGDCVFGRGGA